jgi:uncharacterized membrane protein
MVFALTLPDGNILRIIFGLPFLLFLPGYVFVSALWAKKTELDSLERVALSLGLSIAIVPLAGLGLNYTPWGITLTSILVCIYCLILILLIVTWVRRAKLSPNERYYLRLDFIPNNFNAMSSTDKLVILIIAIAIVIGGAILVYIAMNPPEERFTELFLLDVNGTTQDYPSNLTVNESAYLIIGVVCHEQQTIDYIIVVELVLETDVNRTLKQYNFLLADEKEWQQDFNFSINESGKFKLEFRLFKEDETTPYATVHIWIDVRE